MMFPHFLNCLDMLFEQFLSVLRGAVKVDTFLKEEGIPLQYQKQPGTQGQTNSQGVSSIVNSSTASSAVSGASELAHKSISELLRMRKYAHSLVSLECRKHACMFVINMYTNNKIVLWA